MYICAIYWTVKSQVFICLLLLDYMIFSDSLHDFDFACSQSILSKHFFCLIFVHCKYSSFRTDSFSPGSHQSFKRQHIIVACGTTKNKSIMSKT